jgi:hypothetical protein
MRLLLKQELVLTAINILELEQFEQQLTKM